MNGKQTTCFRHFPAPSHYCYRSTVFYNAVDPSNEAVSALLLAHKVEELLLLLFHYYGSYFFNALNISPNEGPYSFRKRVEDAIAGNLSVEQLAQRNHQSLSSFKRHFRKHFGTTPGEYIRKRKLERASLELQRGGEVSELYMNYGYETVSNFIHAFKMMYGVTPKQFQTDFRQKIFSSNVNTCDAYVKN